MSHLDTMINHFNCGCVVVGDIPSIARCEEHDGCIVAFHNQNVPFRRWSNEAEDLNVWQGTLLHNLRRIKDGCFSFIFAYPELNILGPMNWLRPEAWRNADMEMMGHLKRILKPGGYISFVVDPSVLHTVTYQVSKLKMKIDVRGCILDRFEPSPSATLAYSLADAKVHLIVYNEYRDKIPEKGSRILDLSGLKLPYVLKRKKGNKLLVLTGHPYHFDKVTARLEDA